MRAIAAAAAAGTVFLLAWLYRFNDPSGSFSYLTDDHFFYLVRGWQILFGELPVRDFVDHGAPLYYYVGAAVQALFGRGTLSELAFSVTVLAGSAAGVCLLASRASGSLVLGVAVAAGHVLLEPRFYNYPKILVYVVAIAALWAFADRPDVRRTALLAVVTVAAFLFRHDHAVFVAGAFVVLLVLLRSASWWLRVRQALVYAALVLALAAPYIAFLELNGGAVNYFRTAATWAERDRDRAEVVWPGLFENPDGVSPDAETGGPLTRRLATVRDNWAAWGYYAELALPLAGFVLLLLSPHAFRPDWPNAPAKIGMVVALGLMLNAGFLRHPLEARLADPSVPHAILAAWLVTALVSLLWRPDLLRAGLRRPVLMRGVQLAAVLITVPVLAVLIAVVTRDLHERLDKASLAGRPRNAFERVGIIRRAVAESFPPVHDAAADPDNMLTLMLYVRECTRPTDRVFMQHYLPQVLALAERGFAGGHADLRPGFFESPEMQRLTIDRLRRQSVPIALVGTGDTWGGFRPAFLLITAYFDEHYQPAGEHEFNGRYPVQLLVRRDTIPVRPFQPLGWPCFR
jgi:hypothetical protein